MDKFQAQGGGSPLFSWCAAAMAGGSFYFFALVLMYILEIQGMPAYHFRGGPSFALHGYVLLNSAIGWLIALMAIYLLVVGVMMRGGFRAWQLPETMTALLLTPAAIAACFYTLRLLW